MSGKSVPPTPAPTTPWKPSDLPTLRAAYSDRTAALMAYLAAFAYDTRIEAKGVLQVPPELSAFGFDKLTSFHNGMTDGWAYIAEGTDLIALSFRGTSSTKNWDTDFQVALVHPENTDRQLQVHKGFYQAFIRLNEGTLGIKEKLDVVKEATKGAVPIYITGHSLGGALAQIAGAVLGSDQVATSERRSRGAPFVGLAPQRLLDNPRSAVRAVYVPRNKSAEIAARADIGETAAAGNAEIGMKDDLLPGFDRFVSLNRQSIDCALQRIHFFIERIDLP
jgi:Lipase (class 3)